MWPFDMRGPDFLFFNLLIGAIVTTALALLRHSSERSDTPKVNLSDPYLIAFLRGGKNEALRVVTMSLIDRNLLTPARTKISSTEAACGKARSELEQKIVKHFTPSAEASSLFKTKEADVDLRRFAELAATCPNPLTVILERDGSYPPMEHLLAQLDRARRAIAEGRARERSEDGKVSGVAVC